MLADFLSHEVLFFILMVLSSSVFLFVWGLRIISLYHDRNQPDRKNYVRVIIWTVIPAVIIVGLALLGPHLINHMPYLS